MRRIRTFSGLMIFALSCFPAAAQPSCAEVGILANAEVGDSGVTLADLLTAKTCPALRSAAAALWLGNAPQPGATRIFVGSEIRRALDQINHDQFAFNPAFNPALDPLTLSGSLHQALADAHIPERIVVRRSGSRASCREIRDSISRALRARDSTSSQDLPPLELDCGSARQIPEGSALELTRVFWDPALRGWEYSLRCVRPSDCVPFLVRQVSTPAYPGVAWLLPLDSHAKSNRPQTASSPLAVQVGQTATLFWEQDGIRAVLPVTCLDRGPVGGLVRARTKNGNRILRAEVVSPGVLRAAL
jgi:hypothetical protein